MRHKLPINVNPLSIRLPITALVSITHRLSGVFLFLLLPFSLWAFKESIHSPKGFAVVQSLFSNPLFAFSAWVTLSAFWFHLLAGIRHLFMDMHIGLSLWWARRTAGLVGFVSLVGSVALGLRLLGVF